MQTALETFDLCIERARSLHGLQGALSAQVTDALDLSDVLRAGIVLSVSALDFFIHEITRLGMIDSWSGARQRTGAFNRFQMSVSTFEGLTNATDPREILDAEIRNVHGYKSFQKPDAIAKAVRLFSDVPLWKAVGECLGRSEEEIKSSLKLIVERRNKISHEADIDPSYPGQRWPIDAPMVEGIFAEISSIAHAIHNVTCQVAPPTSQP